ncbi:uncharacterized protein N0V96_007529 [Colletotrichum fioriniae]|uniref:uncharacterized protein n=1 Tax=Colletotrichum fioriniae TaxID=710243 RepID=UPI0032DB525E|nr:hypothetical protein N0V96_007529 [Colletotrichum fioriniae]
MAGLSKRLEPYFSAIDSYSSVKPEILGLIWGTVQFLFKLCRNYESFMEKLADMISQVTNDLRLHERYALSSMKMAHGLNKSAFATCKIFWVPFDDHFADFRRKFKAHQAFLESCLRSEQMTARIMAFQQLKQQNKDELDRLAQIQKEVDKLKQNKFASLKQWLNPDPWTTAFENAKRRRHPNTSTWILDHPCYQGWMETFRNNGQETEAPTNEDTLFPQILALQAKPGYGKSVLCTQIIEDLLRASADRKQDGVPGGSVVFYFFDKQTASERDYSDAFRAIITQLLHQNQDHPELMDLGFIIRDFSGSGQLNGSTEDLKALLSLILRKLREPTLVLDGLDECIDVHRFLQDILAVTASTKTRIIFSSRPNIDYHRYIHRGMESVFLEEEGNLQDIKSFLFPEINQLVQSELLILEDTAEEITCMIAEKSRSMFLWASLLVEHLKSEMMTPEDRLEVINDMSLFPELDSLYARILHKLHSLHKSRGSQRNLRRLFDWICVAARPLTARELREAIALRVGSATKASQRIKYFEQSIIRMTGSLVEVASDKTTIVANPDTFRLRDMLDDLSEGWEVTYEIKDVQSQDPVLNIRLNLPPQQIRRLLQKSFASQEPKRFEFPASFSPDLRQITVLKYLIRVLPSQPSDSLHLSNSSSGKNTTTVLANPLKGLSFSHCGNFIHGEKVGGNKEFVMVPIARELQRFKPHAPKLFGSATLSRGQSELAPKEQHLMQLPTTVESQPTLGTDAVVFSQQQNGRQISVIRQYGNSGELVFYKTMDNGDFVSECLMRLPKSSSLDMGHATFLNTFETEADARIIINKELQDTYSVEESVGEDLKLPLLINRSRESIPRHMENKRLAVSEFNSPSKRICR